MLSGPGERSNEAPSTRWWWMTLRVGAQAGRGVSATFYKSDGDGFGVKQLFPVLGKNRRLVKLKPQIITTFLSFRDPCKISQEPETS